MHDVPHMSQSTPNEDNYGSQEPVEVMDEFVSDSGHVNSGRDFSPAFSHIAPISASDPDPDPLNNDHFSTSDHGSTHIH
ncbi:hypothetical protein V6N12_007548 [Hibiscus sabdariffa]|uniref:Uncharacterized protein n=1 Tax=Hibiscus sabdariffa TaxID=183260 RepID=A0ABR2F233_9ROSI